MSNEDLVPWSKTKLMTLIKGLDRLRQAIPYSQTSSTWMRRGSWPYQKNLILRRSLQKIGYTETDWCQV